MVKVLKPDFFIVGAPKCGTTAMHTYLGQHPEIFMPLVKEPHFFGSDLQCVRYTNNLERYQKLFYDGLDLICGESSALYLISQQAACEIYGFRPDAKIIIMIRNPVDLMYSLHNETVWAGNEDVYDFKKALELGEARKRGECLPKGCRYPEAVIYQEIPKFVTQIQRYLATFGEEQVHIIVFDDLKQDAVGVYRRVLDFLEVNSSHSVEFRALNQSKYIRSQFLRSMIQSAQKYGRWLFRPLFPPKIRYHMLKAAYGINTRHQKRPPMEPELRKQIQERFARDVEQLSALLDRDLTHWSIS